MRLAVPDNEETIWDYEGRENFIVVPITGFLRKDNAVAMVHPIAKEAEDRYPKLANKWGWLTVNGAIPTHRTKKVNLIGLKDRKHYASNPDDETVTESLLFLNELSLDNPDYVFYLDGYLGGEKLAELNKQLLTSDRIVILERGHIDE